MPDQDNHITDEVQERGQWMGSPVFDATFVGLMQELKTRDDISEGSP